MTPMGQQSFFYYNPEQTEQNRSHGHYTPHPQSMPMGQVDYFSYNAGIAYSRPQSAGHQLIYQQQPQYISQAMLTPATSPREMQQKATIMLQQEMPYMRLDTSYMPATPTLSATGSFASIDSPQNCGPLPTPIDTEYYCQTFPVEVSKKMGEEEMFADVLNSGDWSASNSPPTTPGMYLTLPIIEFTKFGPPSRISGG